MQLVVEELANAAVIAPGISRNSQQTCAPMPNKNSEVGSISRVTLPNNARSAVTYGRPSRTPTRLCANGSLHSSLLASEPSFSTTSIAMRRPHPLIVGPPSDHQVWPQCSGCGTAFGPDDVAVWIGGRTGFEDDRPFSVPPEDKPHYCADC
jgi:hypothetical protein